MDGWLLIQAIHGLQGIAPPVGVQFSSPAELCEQGKGTTAWTQEVEQRMEQLPRSLLRI